jgi:hypothetical protein
MLVITAQVRPGGNPAEARWVGTVASANVSRLADQSDYVAVTVPDAGDRRVLWVPAHRRSNGWQRLAVRVLTGSGCEPLAPEWHELAAAITACVEAGKQR